jgi:hypothetical protein
VYLFCILLKRIRAGDRLALLLMASLVGFLAVGLADSVFDEPRMALLFFFMVWLSMIKPPQPENRVLPGLSEVPRPGVAHL